MRLAQDDDTNDAESIDQDGQDSKRRMHRTLPRVKVILEDDEVSVCRVEGSFVDDSHAIGLMIVRSCPSRSLFCSACYL